VYLRDTQPLLEASADGVVLDEPHRVPYRQVSDQLGRWSSLYLLNPITSILITFQRIFYNKVLGRAGRPSLPDGSVWW